MRDKPVKGDKLWRTAALILLCGLVYYFSYDHGRQEMERRMESISRQALEELELQRDEIVRLRKLLSECRDGGSDTPAVPPGSIERFTLRANQSRIVFDGRLVVTLLKVESADNKALVQLNFIDEERLVSEELMAGGAFRFKLEDRAWALVLGGLSMSSVSLNLMEIKNE